MTLTLSPIEQAVVRHLRDLGLSCSTVVPSPRPSRFVVVERSGGSRRNLAQSDPTLLVQCWGATQADAWEVTRRAWQALAVADETDLPLGVQVMRLSITEPANYPDEASGTPRYTFTFTPTVNL